MSDENISNSAVSGDVDVGSVSLSGDTGTGDTGDTGNSEQLDPRLKPGVPVEEIPGLDEAKARELGLLKSDEDYKRERSAEVHAAEEFDHQGELQISTTDLVASIRESLALVHSVATAVNQSYGKFTLLGMQEEADAIIGLQGNLHFNAIIESLQEAKARAILLNVELSDL